MEKTLIIIAILFFVFVIGKNHFDRKKSDSEPANENKNNNAFNFRNIMGINNSSSSESPDRTDKTIVLSPWMVYVLDKEGNIVDEREMNVTEAKPFSIGYDDDCDLVIKSKYVSSVHLRVGKDSQGYFAKDNNSSNGTFVGDEEIRGTSFPLEEMLVYVADVPIYFKKRNNDRPKVDPKFFRNEADDSSKTKNFDEFNKTKSWKSKKREESKDAPLTR